MLALNTRLAGGYINDVRLRDAKTVAKHFTGEDLTGIPSSQRMKREALALAHFGGTLAPQLLGLADITIFQQFIGGETYEKLIQENLENKDCISDAGRILAGINTPVHRPFVYLQEEIESKISKYSKKARPVLDAYFKKTPIVQIDWEEVKKFGSTRVHRDLWLGNIINGIAIDWEFSGIGSPYEDFAIAELWIFMQYGGKNEFYNSYGKRPDEKTVLEFLKLKCFQFLSTTTPANIEEEEPGGFYHNKLSILQELCSHEN